jgi:phage terminase small subunit
LYRKAGDFMTDRQRKFADEYLIDCNATRAYKAAYPRIRSEDAARVNGSRLLTNASIKGYIDEQLEKISSEKVADAKEVMEYLTSVLRGESVAEIVVVEGCGEGCSSAKRMDKAPDERERLKAAELLGKRYGMFKDNVNVTGAVPVIISDDMNEDD